MPLIAPKNLKVSEEWYNRFRITWDTPPSPTMGYRVIYQPVSGKHTSPSLPAMRDCAIGPFAGLFDGAADVPRRRSCIDVFQSSLCVLVGITVCVSVRVCAAPGRALETFVGDDVNTMLILNLMSGTEYSVKVIATYTTGSSEPLAGRAKTREFPNSTTQSTHTHAFPPRHTERPRHRQTAAASPKFEHSRR